VWLLFDLGILFIFLSLLFYRPMKYKEPQPTNSNVIGEHWTRLSSQIYNNAQLARPFEITISENEINLMVLDSGWPKESSGVSFSAPQVFLEPEQIVLMGTASFEDVKVIVTVAGKADIDEAGLMNLKVTKFKVGALNVTLPARLIAKRNYSQALSNPSIDREDIRTKIVSSLLNDEPFEPVFVIEDKKVRISKVQVLEKKIKIDFEPALD